METPASRERNGMKIFLMSPRYDNRKGVLARGKFVTWILGDAVFGEDFTGIAG
jgi:hypothetical protein